MRASMTIRLAAAAAAAMTLVGCSHTPKAVPSTTALSPSASPPTDPAVAATQATVLERYRAFRQAYDEAGLTADYKSKAVVQYLESPLQQRVVAFLLQTNQHKAVYRGQAQSNPSVTKVDLKAKPPTALVTDCYDSTNYRLYYTSNNSPVPVPSGSRRYIIETVATDFGGTRGWLFTSSTSYPERTC